MKSLYRIIDDQGHTLCFQVGTSIRDALDTAKTYGHGPAVDAEWVRFDD